MQTKWTKQNAPAYTDDRVNIKYEYDDSTKRHLWHKQHICIDDVVVITQEWPEDDDWEYSYTHQPDAQKAYKYWLESLPEE